MEIFQTIWTALTTENERLFNLISIPLFFVDAYVIMLLFTTVLNIPKTQKQQLLYVLIVPILGLIINISIPSPYCKFIEIILDFILIFYIFKTTIIKSILSGFLSLNIITVLEIIFARIYLLIFGTTYEQFINVPIYRLIVISIIYFTIFILSKLVDHFKLYLPLIDIMDKNTKLNLLFNLILGIVIIITQFYLIGFYNDRLPSFIILLNVISLVAYFSVSIYSLTRISKLQIANQNLEEAQLYNKSLRILHDNIRAFKHDFSNIVQAIGGYVDSKDLDGLGNYYSQLLEDCQRVNNLTTLSPDVINNPAIYSILASKYHRADEIGIKINLDVFLDLNEVNMKIYEFTRILGILMDNAIEASSKCDEKVINVSIRKDFKCPRQLLVIENTYTNKDVDTDKIFEKGYTSKTEESASHGLGLWEVRQVLKKNNNLNLYTTKNDQFFNQQLEIYS